MTEHRKFSPREDLLDGLDGNIPEKNDGEGEKFSPLAVKDEPKQAPKERGANTARTRVPIGQQSRLAFPNRPGYVRRMVNDTRDGERIKSFELAGWTVVKAKNMPGGDTRAGADSQMGDTVNRSVGGGTRGVLMEIPEEWYKEDQKAKQEKVNEAENDLRRQLKVENRYGKVEISQSG